MQVVEKTRFWLFTISQIALLTVILQYLNSPLPFCYRLIGESERICITANSSTCHIWVEGQVRFIPQGLVYRSPDRICTSQMIWLMKALVYTSFTMILWQIVSRKQNGGVTPNGVAFSYFTLIATISIFLLNSYMKCDWRQYWKEAAAMSNFSNSIRHEPILYLIVSLFVIQSLSFLDNFQQLYGKTWSHW
ncbi:unnamed protein product [Cylicocyclus nassatus]|uniref:Uncharacterized protein n=1 Tax=Cylicocyclus nassatus TaxID=53992 RepID=A0AA36DQE6_CYLNA|nr:unnamed protein product [Cylicocyclus nassatus]